MARPVQPIQPAVNWPDPNPPRPKTPCQPGDPDYGKYDLDVRDAQEDPNQKDWSLYAEPKAPDGAPNILYIVFDDTGFGAWSMFGGKIQMPNLERIANKGLIYTNFHTTALCSPTRSSLLNGRNANSNGMACIEEATNAFPGSNGRIPKENAFIAETLGERGYNTYCLGKWHLCPEEEANMASTKRNWPLQRGFERYYGFLGGETDQWYPDLIYDNHQVEPPYGPDMNDTVNGYHLSKDLADKAISFIHDGKIIAPDKPWMMYFCPGANHAPHQIWPELIGEPGYPADKENPNNPGQLLNDLCRYNAAEFDSPNNDGYGTYTPETSVFKDGYEQYREDITARMATPLGEPVSGQPGVTGLGIFPPGTLPTKRNPHGEGEEDPDNPSLGVDEGLIPDKQVWPGTEYVLRWGNKYGEDGKPEDDLAARQKLFVRMAETYAAFSTYTDRQIGRLLDYLEETGQMDNTIIIAVADNGASGEGGPNGSINENLFFNDIPDDLETNKNAIANIGTDKTYNHYPSGWAWGFDAPFKYWKRWSSYEGGDATPFMICGPGIDRATDGSDSGFRKQYVHACDLVPTLYKHLNLTDDDIKRVKGYRQNPMDGKSFAYTFNKDFDEPNYPDPNCQYPYRFNSGEYGSPTGDDKKETQFYAMLGTRGIWHKGWHACPVHPPTPSDWGYAAPDTWELYCMDGDTLSGDIFGDGQVTCYSDETLDADPTQANPLNYELKGAFGNDLRNILTYLQAKWEEEANKYFGKPLDDRSTADVLGEERPQLSEPPPNGRYTFPYYPGCSEIPEAVAPNIRTRSYSITATVDLGRVTDISKVHGVLFSHGGRFGGHSFYIHEGKLCYVYNWLGQQAQRISCDINRFLGSKHEIRIEFQKTGEALNDEKYGSSVVGTVTLSEVQGLTATPLSGVLELWDSDANGGQGGWGLWNTDTADWSSDAQFMTQPAKFSLCGEGMNIGRDVGQPVSPDYKHEIPFEFEGATLQQVVVKVEDDATPTDGTKDLKGMLWRD